MADNDRPKWLIALELADDEAKLLAALADAEEAAVQGFLRQNNLADPGLQSQRIQAISQELQSQKLTGKSLFSWRDYVLAVESAVDEIADFRQRHPLIEEFRDDHNLARGNDDVVLETIRKALWRGECSLPEWVEFLDKRRDETDRHLFLFRLPPGATKWPQLNPVFEWKVKQPQPVKCEGELGKKLKLQIVGWRRAATPNRKDRRTVTFAHLDMERGTMELQLQRMRGGGMAGLLAERDRYLREVAALLQIRPEPIRLEPAIRSLLTENRLTLEYWMVRTPEGGELSGRREPGLFEKIKLDFRRFYALDLKGRWKVSQGSEIPVRMNARTDAIDVYWQCEAAVLDEFISTIRHRVETSPQVKVEQPAPSPGTADDAEKLPELKALLEKLVEYLQRLGEDVAIHRPGRATTNDLLFNAETLEEALNMFGVRSLGVTLYVMCPISKTPIFKDGRMAEFERPEDVPEEIICNDGHEERHHFTKNNVWLKVGPGGGLPPIPKAVLYSFSLGYPIFFMALTYFSVRLSVAYPGILQSIFIVVGYLLAAFAPIVAIRKKYGKRAFDDAFGLIREFLSVFLRFIPSGSQSKSNTGAPDKRKNSQDDDD